MDFSTKVSFLVALLVFLGFSCQLLYILHLSPCSSHHHHLSLFLSLAILLLLFLSFSEFKVPSHMYLSLDLIFCRFLSSPRYASIRLCTVTVKSTLQILYREEAPERVSSCVRL